MCKKTIISFEVDQDQADFIAKRAKMNQWTKSGYLRFLVQSDQAAWSDRVNRWWQTLAEKMTATGEHHEA